VRPAIAVALNAFDAALRDAVAKTIMADRVPIPEYRRQRDEAWQRAKAARVELEAMITELENQR
jgi:hypothetical protein